MPYAQDQAGIYRIVNKETNQCYVGGSKRVRKRAAEHFRLLRAGIHPNPHLQNSFGLYGEKSFFWELEVVCEDPNDLDQVEELFLSKEAWFQEPVVFNISNAAKAPMRGRSHTQETRSKISETKKSNPFLVDESYREKLRHAHRQRLLSDKNFVEKVRFIVDNPTLSYAERGRRLGMDTGSVRKLALKYSDLKGKL